MIFVNTRTWYIRAKAIVATIMLMRFFRQGSAALGSVFVWPNPFRHDKRKGKTTEELVKYESISASSSTFFRLSETERGNRWWPARLFRMLFILVWELYCDNIGFSLICVAVLGAEVACGTPIKEMKSAGD